MIIEIPAPWEVMQETLNGLSFMFGQNVWQMIYRDCNVVKYPAFKVWNVHSPWGIHILIIC